MIHLNRRRDNIFGKWIYIVDIILCDIVKIRKNRIQRYVFKKHNMMRDIKFLVDKIITMISFLIITITNEKNILS